MPRNREIPSFVYDPNCVLYLPLWKRDGLTFISDDAGGKLCTATGATWGTQGRTYASGNYITADIPAMNFTSGDFSLWAWVKSTNLAANQAILYRGAINTEGYFWLILTNGATDFYTAQSGAMQNTNATVAVVTSGTWVFCGIRRTGASVQHIKNGALVAQTSGTHTDPLTSTRTVKFGIRDDTTNDPFIGTLGEVGATNRYLSIAEFQQIYLSTRWRYQ